jgi:hypothetical protein
MRGQIESYTRYRQRWHELQHAAGLSTPLIRDSIYASVIDIDLRRDTTEALRRLDARLRHEVATLPEQRSWEVFHMAHAYSLANRPNRARETLRVFKYSSNARTSFKESMDNVLASIAVAEGKTDEALALYRAGDRSPDGPATECSICIKYYLARVFDRSGLRDSAIAMYKAYVSTPDLSRLELRGWGDERSHPERTALAYERLGQLCEQKGDTTCAVDSYRKFTELWRSADPLLMPRVMRARERVSALRRQPP